MEDRHAGQLRDLAAMGMDMARVIHAAVMAGEGPADADLRFARVSRAVRQSIALEKRLSDEWAEERADNPPPDHRGRAAEHRDRCRNRSHRIIETAGGEFEREGPDAYADFAEALADAAEEDDFLDRPVEEIIAQIRRHLGLASSPAKRDEGDRPPKSGGWRGKASAPTPSPITIGSTLRSADGPLPPLREGSRSPPTAPGSPARGSPPSAGP